MHATATRQRVGRQAVFGNRIKIDDELYAKAKKCAELAGYSSAEEFIQHVLEKEITLLMGSDSDGGDAPEEIKKRLQGLGYIE
jgi:hypothetical protein